MALSDACSDVSDQLASDIIHYFEWKYEVESISKLVDAIFLLASFQASQDAPFLDESEPFHANKRIVINMFDNLLQQLNQDTRSIFSEVVKTNKRLSDALIEIEPESSLLID